MVCNIEQEDEKEAGRVGRKREYFMYGFPRGLEEGKKGEGNANRGKLKNCTGLQQNGETRERGKGRNGKARERKQTGKIVNAHCRLCHAVIQQAPGGRLLLLCGICSWCPRHPFQAAC